MNIIRFNKDILEATIVQHKDRIAYNITADHEVQKQESEDATGKENDTVFTSIVKTLLNDGFIITEVISNND